MTLNQPTPYMGSERTAKMVRDQIAKRWGEEVAEEYDPETNCMSYREWEKRGYAVMKGQKSIKTPTQIEMTDEKGETHKITRTVHLFFKNQVHEMSEK